MPPRPANTDTQKIPHAAELTQARLELRHGLLNTALKWGEGVDKSGRPYEWLFDCREMLLQGPYLHHAARLLWRRLAPYNIQMVGGMTMAANPLTIALMYESRLANTPVDAFLIRRESKTDGLRRLIEGPPIAPGTRVALIDDLVNSGDTQETALQALRSTGCEVAAIAVLLDYERRGSGRLRAEGHVLEALFTFSDLGMRAVPPAAADAWQMQWKWGVLNSGKYGAPKSSPRCWNDTIYVGSDRGFLVALSLEGKEKWSYRVRDTERGVHSTPLVHDGKVYFGSYDGFLYCVDGDSGNLVWETRPAQWIGSSPALDEAAGLIYIGLERGECDGSLAAFDAASGQMRWEVPTAHYVHSSPFYDAPRRQVIVGANDGFVYAVDSVSGRLHWRFSTGGHVKSNAAVDSNGICLVGSCDGYLYAIRADSGQLMWKRRLASQLYNTPLFHDDLVIVGTYARRVVALSRQHGEVRWVASTDGFIVGGAVMGDDENCMIGSTDGKVYAFSTHTGKPTWNFRTNGQIMGSPGRAKDLTLVPSFDGHLYAFSTSSSALEASPP